MFLKAFLDTRYISRLFLSPLSSYNRLNPIASKSPVVVLAAEELRYDAQAVGRVIGEIGTEDMVNVKGFSYWEMIMGKGRACKWQLRRY